MGGRKGGRKGNGREGKGGRQQIIVDKFMEINSKGRIAGGTRT